MFIAQWLSGGNSEILHSSNVFARRHKLSKPEIIFKQTRVNFFTGACRYVSEHHDVTFA